MKRQWLLLGAVALVIGLGAGVWYLLAHPLSGNGLAAGDTVTSWAFKGPYQDGGPLEKQATDEITHLKSLLGSGQYSDYDLLVGIAAQYELLGDGKSAVDYLNQAITKDPKKGIAYLNLGHLMDTLGAYNTAKQAYDKAVTVEPSVTAYQTARADFLKKRFPNEHP